MATPEERPRVNLEKFIEERKATQIYGHEAANVIIELCRRVLELEEKVSQNDDN